MPHRAREKEHRNSKQQEQGNANYVLNSIIGMKGYCVLPALCVNANRVVRTETVQRYNMQHNDASNQKRHQIMQ